MAELEAESILANEDFVSKAREAISELFLDTELQDYDYQYITRTLRETGFSLDELDRIYEEEVAPAVYMNLNVTAGVWVGFDQVWLAEKIVRKKKWIDFLKKNHFVWNVYRAWITRDTHSDWKKIRKALEIPEADQ